MNNYTCVECELETENYNLLKQDIGRKCPECGSGQIIFVGFCRDCYSKLTVYDTSDQHRCSNCKTGHPFKSILREPHQ